MHRISLIAVGLAALVGLSCVAASVYAQDSAVARLLDERYDPAMLAADEDTLIRDNFDVEQAALWLQQPAGQPAAPSLDSAARRTTRGSRQANVGLASVPNMFGDCACGTTAIITAIGPGGQITDSQFRLPAVGGARTGKMADNDIAMPVDRIFCSYSHFSDAFMMHTQQSFPQPGPLLSRQEPIDRYVMGVEKTFFNQMTSIEVRMPFSGSFNATLPGLAVDNGNFGNMAVILKGLVWQGQNLGIGTGMAIDTPTGSSILSHVNGTNLRILNDAVHLLPYLGFLYAPGDPQWGWGNGLFVTGFMQIDTAANGNRVQFTGPNNSNPTTIGKYNEQDLMYLDLSVGYWLYRNPYAQRWTGFAVVNEMHYTTSLARPDLVAGATGGTGLTVTNPNGHIDVTNYTIGVQALMYDLSSLRVCGVFPLGSRTDSRFFDAELQVQFNRRF
jgi:hypothetical protein